MPIALSAAINICKGIRRVAIRLAMPYMYGHTPTMRHRVGGADSPDVPDRIRLGSIVACLLIFAQERTKASLMMYQSRHYNSIAKIVHDLRLTAIDHGDLYLLESVDTFCARLIETFTRDNPRFSPTRFTAACVSGLVTRSSRKG